MKLGVQQLADFDQSVRDMNSGIVKIRELCAASDDVGKFFNQQMQAIHGLARAVDSGLVSDADGLRGMARLLDALANATAECEASHPDERCSMGVALMHAFTVPAQMEILASFCGLTFARGKRIK